MIPDLDSDPIKSRIVNTYGGVMIPALDLDPELDFQAIPDPDSDPVKRGIITPLVSLLS